MRTPGQRLAAVAAALSLLSAFLLSAVGAPPAAGTQSWSHRDARVCGQAGAGPPNAPGWLERSSTRAASSSRPGPGRTSPRRPRRPRPPTTRARASGPPTASPAQGNPSKVIAIVDAYDDPSAFANLTTFRSGWGLPAMASQPCTLATAHGHSRAPRAVPASPRSTRPAEPPSQSANAGWSNEIDLDLQAASSVCPTVQHPPPRGDLGFDHGSRDCRDHRLERDDRLDQRPTCSRSRTVTASRVTTRGASPRPTTTPLRRASRSRRRRVTMATGSSSRRRRRTSSASGGTTLAVGANGVRTSETAWSGTGQRMLAVQRGARLAEHPRQPVRGQEGGRRPLGRRRPELRARDLHDTTAGTTGYWVFGGTSLASPLIAALYAMQGGYSATTLAGQYAWAAGTPTTTSPPARTGRAARRCCARRGPAGTARPGSAASPWRASSARPDDDHRVSPTTASVQTGGPAAVHRHRV